MSVARTRARACNHRQLGTLENGRDANGQVINLLFNLVVVVVVVVAAAVAVSILQH